MSSSSSSSSGAVISSMEDNTTTADIKNGVTSTQAPVTPNAQIYNNINTYYSTSNYLQKRPNMDYTGRRIYGYAPETNYVYGNGLYPHGRPPSAYDGLLYDYQIHQTYDNTFYITGLIACISVFTLGILIYTDK